jgi:hypothetical protein
MREDLRWLTTIWTEVRPKGVVLAALLARVCEGGMAALILLA